MTKRLILLDQAGVRARWNDQLRPGIELALRHDPDGQLPEDVFMAIMGGNAGLYATLDDDGVATGFIVARKLEISGRSVLVVWLCWNGNRETTVAGFWDQVEEIASELGCSRIAIESTRPYHRAIPGVRLVSHTYHYEVGHGRQQADHH